MSTTVAVAHLHLLSPVPLAPQQNSTHNKSLGDGDWEIASSALRGRSPPPPATHRAGPGSMAPPASISKESMQIRQMIAPSPATLLDRPELGDMIDHQAQKTEAVSGERETSSEDPRATNTTHTPPPQPPPLSPSLQRARASAVSLSRIEPIERIGNSLEMEGEMGQHGWSPTTLVSLSPSMLHRHNEAFLKGAKGRKKKSKKKSKVKFNADGTVAARGPSTTTGPDGKKRQRGRARNQRWSADEDAVLREQVRKFTELAHASMAKLDIKPSQLPYFDASGRLHGSIKWCVVAENLPGRVGKQCRERWMNHLDPSVKKCKWSDEEDETMIRMQQQFGNRWSEIAKSLPGRSENAVKNRWNSRLRKNQLRMKRAEQASNAPNNAVKTAKASASAAANSAATASVAASSAPATIIASTVAALVPAPFVAMAAPPAAAPSAAALVPEV